MSILMPVPQLLYLSSNFSKLGFWGPPTFLLFNGAGHSRPLATPYQFESRLFHFSYKYWLPTTCQELARPLLPARSATSRQGPPAGLPGRTPEGPRWGGAGWLLRCLPAGASRWRTRSEMTSILRSPQALQLTLALIKPDAVAHPLILEAVHQQILSNKFLIVRMRELLWRKEECQKFYQEHEGRFFYQRLVEFMASGPIRAYILARKDAIQLWRTLMGPTRVFRARHVAPDSIRGSFGLTDTRNTTHGSDSVVSASREIAAFFPDFSEQRWYEEEEPQLRCGPVRYSPEGGIHCAAGPGGPGPARCKPIGL